MIVKVAPIGERVQEVNVEANTTVGQALDIAEVDDNGRTITVNGQPASLDTVITQEGTVIALAGKMKGGK